MKTLIAAVLGVFTACSGCGRSKPPDARSFVESDPTGHCTREGESPTSDRPNAVTERQYGEYTLAEWRDILKDLDPQELGTDSAVPGLIDIVRDTKVPEFTRRQAAYTLGCIGAAARDAVPILIEVLDQANEELEPSRIWAIKALALFGPEAQPAARKLIQILQDECACVTERIAVLEPLTAIGTAHPNIIPSVAELLNVQTDDRSNLSAAERTRLCRVAAESLGLIGPHAASTIPVLIRSAQAADEGLRQKSVTALGAMKSRGNIAIPSLADIILVDSSAVVRDAAAEALANVGISSIPAFEQLLQDADAEVRWRAAAGLGKIGRAAKTSSVALQKALQDESSLVRINVAEAIWKISSDAEMVVPVLVQELTNEDRQIRIQSIRLLASIEPSAKIALTYLEKLLKDDREYVRKTAAQALKKITAM